MPVDFDEDEYPPLVMAEPGTLFGYCRWGLVLMAITDHGLYALTGADWQRLPMMPASDAAKLRASPPRTTN